MYYVMQAADPVGQPLIRLQRVDEYTESWMSGARFAPTREPPNPLRMRFHPQTEGTLLRDLYQAPICLMSKRLILILRDVGVDNLDLYPAIILDEARGQSHETHSAVNIIGVVSAADLRETVFDPLVPERVMTAAIDKLVIDERATRGQFLFRLAENVQAIVVHEKVVEHVKAANLGTIAFLEPQEWFSF